LPFASNPAVASPLVKIGVVGVHENVIEHLYRVQLVFAILFVNIAAILFGYVFNLMLTGGVAVDILR
jgi:hypothetical protein